MITEKRALANLEYAAVGAVSSLSAAVVALNTATEMMGTHDYILDGDVRASSIYYGVSTILGSVIESLNDALNHGLKEPESVDILEECIEATIHNDIARMVGI